MNVGEVIGYNPEYGWDPVFLKVFSGLSKIVGDKAYLLRDTLETYVEGQQPKADWLPKEERQQVNAWLRKEMEGMGSCEVAVRYKILEQLGLL